MLHIFLHSIKHQNETAEASSLVRYVEVGLKPGDGDATRPSKESGGGVSELSPTQDQM